MCSVRTLSAFRCRLQLVYLYFSLNHIYRSWNFNTFTLWPRWPTLDGISEVKIFVSRWQRKVTRMHLVSLSCIHISKGGRKPTASRQASRHETKDAVLLHSWFRFESAHRSSTCLRRITSSLVDDMTSSSEEVHWCCSLITDVWVLTHRKGTCRVLLHVSAAWSWRQHHDSDRCAAVFIISFVSTVLLSLHQVADIVSWLLHVLTHAGVRPN
jgi:hypothetical protein